MAAGAGLGALPELEVEGLDVPDLVDRPAEPTGRQFVEVPRVLLLLLGQHAALTGTDPRAGPLSAERESCLRLLRESAEAHVGHEQRNVESERSVGGLPDRDIGADLCVVEQRAPCELGRDDLDRIPTRQAVAWHPHRCHRAVVPDLRQPIGGQLADIGDVRLVGSAVRILIGALVCVAVPGLRMFAFPGQHLIEVDDHLAVVDPRRELLQPFVVVVGADSGAEAVVPAVYAAHQILAADRAVGEQRTAMLAASVQHRELLVVADDHQIDVADESADRDPVVDFIPASDGDWLHARPPESTPTVPVCSEPV